MTQSVDQKASAAASATNEWLTAFQKALTARDADAAAALRMVGLASAVAAEFGSSVQVVATSSPIKALILPSGP